MIQSSCSSLIMVKLRRIRYVSLRQYVCTRDMRQALTKLMLMLSSFSSLSIRFGKAESVSHSLFTGQMDTFPISSLNLLRTSISDRHSSRSRASQVAQNLTHSIQWMVRVGLPPFMEVVQKKHGQTGVSSLRTIKIGPYDVDVINICSLLQDQSRWTGLSTQIGTVGRTVLHFQDKSRH